MSKRSAPNVSVVGGWMALVPSAVALVMHWTGDAPLSAPAVAAALTAVLGGLGMALERYLPRRRF